MARSLQLDVPSTYKLQFKDVHTAMDFHPISSLANHQVINDYPDGSFGITDPMTRAKAAKILTLVFELPLAAEESTPFQDLNTQSELYPYIQTLYAYGITNGISTTEFGPDDYVNRASLVVYLFKKLSAFHSMIHRFFHTTSYMITK